MDEAVYGRADLDVNGSTVWKRRGYEVNHNDHPCSLSARAIALITATSTSSVLS
jgi:hypothetical protein